MLACVGHHDQALTDCLAPASRVRTDGISQFHSRFEDADEPSWAPGSR